MKTRTLNSQISSSTWPTCLAMMFATVTSMMPDYAFATPPPGNPPIGTSLCYFAAWLAGDMGKGLSIIGIAIAGVRAMQGKLTRGKALLCVLGVILVVGAAWILPYLGNYGHCGVANNPISVTDVQPNGVQFVFCKMALLFMGGVGLAILSVIILGIGALLGKITVDAAVMVAIGIAVLYGADAIFDAIIGPNHMFCPRIG